MRILPFILCCALVFTAQAAVYKQVDKDGNIIYTDVPSKKEEKPLTVRPPTVIKIPSGNTAGTAESRSKKSKKQTNVSYNISVTSPGNDQAIRENSGTVTLQASVNPGLKPGMVIVFLLDGNEVAKGTETKATVSNIDRGTHSVQAKILSDQEVIATSDTIQFHLQRFFIRR